MTVTLKVVAAHPVAKMVDGEAVKVTQAALHSDDHSAQLSIAIDDDELAARFVAGAELELDLDELRPPPPEKPAPRARTRDELRADAEGEAPPDPEEASK